VRAEVFEREEERSGEIRSELLRIEGCCSGETNVICFRRRRASSTLARGALDRF
jgi:hypothetical protein